MKPPWLAQSQESAELEVLQTDVMRFVAILGLCLAAIFSLVHSAALEQRAPAENQAVDVPARPAVPVAPPEAVAPQAQVTAKSAAASTPPSPPERGFTLEFSSAAALDSLLRKGMVALYLRRDDSFLRLGPAGRFQPSAAPHNYYVMAAQTVPEKYVAAMSAHVANKQASWGVTLPDSISGQISRHMQSRQSGSLVIDEGGRVSLHDTAVP